MNSNVRHSVGYKVVALSSSPSPQSQKFVKNKIYTVLSVSYCGGCGTQRINIGGNPYQNGSIVWCNKGCGFKQPNMGKAWTSSYNFAPLSDTTLQHAVEEENYELAAIIRDALKTEKV